MVRVSWDKELEKSERTVIQVDIGCFVTKSQRPQIVIGKIWSWRVGIMLKNQESGQCYDERNCEVPVRCISLSPNVFWLSQMSSQKKKQGLAYWWNLYISWGWGFWSLPKRIPPSQSQTVQINSDWSQRFSQIFENIRKGRSCQWSDSASSGPQWARLASQKLDMDK